MTAILAPNEAQGCRHRATSLDLVTEKRLRLVSGSRLGAYEIIAPLGAGGMGEVYRARDTTLNRDVAIKVLPDAFAGDPDRLGRFRRESHVLASLNHPNIAQIYGVDESGSTGALVMELVTGRTLDEARTTLSIDDVVGIARQIAEALEAAHDQGIIHRDLKPANVKIRDDGTVKVLDFGLAKAFEAGPGSRVDVMNSPTLTVHATQMGVIVGTAAYMAPEQARGKPVDRRADVWAFGAVLYEMLANVRAFDGETASDILAAVLTKEPDWSNVRHDAPASLIELAQRCLRKDPRRRPQAMGDVRLALEEAGAASDESLPARAATAQSAWRRWAVAVLMLAAGAGAGSILTRSFTSRPERAARTVPMQLAADVSLAPDEAPPFAISRDGMMFAFVGGSGNSRKLYVRRLDTPAATPVAGTDGAASPFFSPDGQWLAFIATESLKKVRIGSGAPPLSLTTATDRGGVWMDDDTIIYSPTRVGPLFRIPAAGGQSAAVTQITAGTPTTSHRFPTWITGRSALLFTSLNSADTGPVIASVDLRSGNQTIVLQGAYQPVYAEPGRLLFMRDSALFSVGFDAERLAVTGPETRVVESLRANTGIWAGHFAASGGTLLYQPGTLLTSADQATVVWRDLTGKERPLLAALDTYRDPRFSPDGRRLAFAAMPTGAGTDLWVLDRIRGVKTRLTYERSAAEWWPVWTPDGLSIAYSDTGSGIRMIRADGSSEHQSLTQNNQRWQLPGSFSPEARYLAYSELHRETAGDIWILPFSPRGQPQVFLKTPFYEGLPMFSPNGKWIAYMSNESGVFELYVRPFPGPGPKHQVSGDQTFDVHYWSADGTKLFYRSGDGRRMLSVPVRTEGPEFEYGTPSVLFALNPDEYPDMGFWGSFAAAPDGSGFALVKQAQPESAPRSYLMLMLDWNR
jgi:Tol biopolymer transport system component